MKVIITACALGLSILSYGQQLEVTIIGTAHHFKDEYRQFQNLFEVQDFIVNLQPDIICIESIPTYDTLSFREIWPKTMARADQLRDTLKNAEFLRVNGSNPGLLKGAEYYASYDLWNAYYYWDNVVEVGDTLGYFSQYHSTSLKNSEYGLIVFPAARKLEVKKFFGIDYRVGEQKFISNNNKVIKKLLFSFKWKPLGSYLKTQKQYKKAEKEGKLIFYINSAEFQNSFSTLIDELPKRLPKSKEARMVKEYWLERNEIMANRLIAISKEQNAQRVLLTVGSAHVTHIKRFLEKQGHNVTTYGESINNFKN
ncbi:MAG: DUF5694 domain-containing protein [Bacteroidota bacterium]